MGEHSMKRKLITLTALAALLTWNAASALAADWPMFHGLDGENKSAETGLLEAWPEGGPELLWTASGLGGGYSGVSVADGLIYTTGNVDEKSMVFALNLEGEKVWTYANGPSWDKSYEGTRSTPTIDGNRLYDLTPIGNLACLDAKSGKKIWTRNILDDFGGKPPQWALAESVLIDGEKAICCPGGEEASVVALDKMTGETIWTTPSTGHLAGYATAIIFEQDGLRILATMTAKGLLGVNADTGEKLFFFEHPTKYDVTATMPIYHDGRLVISSGYGTTGTTQVKVTVDGDDASVSQVWNSRELDNHHGGIILHEGYLYGSSHGFNRPGKWIVLDWETGELQYIGEGLPRLDNPDRDDNAKGSATYAEGNFYFMTEKGRVALMEANPEGFNIISMFNLPEGGEGPTWAHPVISNGRLYLRHGEFLYCYDIAE